MTDPNNGLSRDAATLSHHGATRLLDAAVKAASEAGQPASVAVYDASANLLAFLRMDGAGDLSATIAQDKAYTSAAFGWPTDQIFELLKNDEPLRLGLVNTPRLVTFGGGYPVKSQGSQLGAIGVSGGHYTQDMAVAQAALKECASI